MQRKKSPAVRLPDEPQERGAARLWLAPQAQRARPPGGGEGRCRERGEGALLPPRCRRLRAERRRHRGGGAAPRGGAAVRRVVTRFRRRLRPP